VGQRDPIVGLEFRELFPQLRCHPLGMCHEGFDFWLAECRRGLPSEAAAEAFRAGHPESAPPGAGQYGARAFEHPHPGI
jgi:hypothetical protein